MSGLIPMPSGFAPALPAPPGRPQLSRKAKAAIVVRVMLNEGADIALEDLPEDCQAELTKAMGQMRLVDKDTLTEVIEEFVSEVDQVGISFKGGIAGALNALDGKINPLTAARLRKEAGVRESGDPWKRIRETGDDVLLPLIESESIEVAAVLLSKLDTKKAALLLSKLPGPQARSIAYAVSLTGSVTPDAVDRIGLALASQLRARPIRAFDETPVERVGSILNSTTSVRRNDVLTGLDERDEGFATAVRKAIFTFANIPTRIAPRDIARIMRELGQDQVITALAGAEDAGMSEAAEYILGNMSPRMADQFREEIADRDKPKASEVEEAMGGIVDTIRDLERAGELVLVVDDDDE